MVDPNLSQKVDGLSDSVKVLVSQSGVNRENIATINANMGYMSRSIDAMSSEFSAWRKESSERLRFVETRIKTSEAIDKERKAAEGRLSGKALLIVAVISALPSAMSFLAGLVRSAK